MNGAGNDFIIINNMVEHLPETCFPTLARTLCERHLSIGANTDAYSTGSGLLAEHLSPANVVTIPLTDKDPVRLGWIYPQNAKLSSHAEGFVRLLEQSIQRSIAYTSSLHRQIVGK